MWSARYGESRTAGAAGGPGKPTRREPDRAPRSDPAGLRIGISVVTRGTSLKTRGPLHAGGRARHWLPHRRLPPTRQRGEPPAAVALGDEPSLEPAREPLGAGLRRVLADPVPGHTRRG